jgi:hypothetical protein
VFHWTDPGLFAGFCHIGTEKCCSGYRLKAHKNGTPIG